ncbi:hypothetical protein BLOT_013063 [Blomia tropicalis]|nr:hypothetical protein BLOT_013063 [Blomia tropicalis]
MSVLFQYLSIYVHSLLLFLLNQVLVYLSDIDDGIYDSEDFRLLFNSIAATCKATENDDDDHLMFRPLTIDDDVDTLGITVFAT